MNVLNYIAKDLKEGEALQDALQALNEQIWIVGDVARRMITDFNPEEAKTLELVASCDEHAPSVELLKKSFTLEQITNGYSFTVGPIPVRLVFTDIGDYIMERRYAGECVAIHLTKKVPLCAPEFFFAPPTSVLGRQDLAPSKEQTESLSELVIFEAALNVRALARQKAAMAKSGSELVNETNPSNVTSVATD